MSLYTRSADGAPGTKLADLASPSPIPGSPDDTYRGVVVYTAPANTTLSRDTSYFIVVRHPGVGSDFYLYRTVSDDEDSGKQPDWSLGNAYLFRNADHELFTITDGGNSLKMDIRGTVGAGVNVGEVLTADTTGITDANGVPTDPNAFTYQWGEGGQRDGRRHHRRDGPLLLPTEDDVGKTLKVKVSFTDKHGYQEGPLTSAASAAVAANDNVKVIWTSTLTATVASTGATGYNSSATSELNAGSLSDPDFDFDSTTYTVDRISTVPSSGDYNTGFSISPLLDLDTFARWTLYLNDEGRFISDGQPAAISDSSNVGWVAGITQSSGVMTWAEGQHVALALMAVNSPATGAPAITGAAREDEVLRVDTSGIADDNGKPAKPGGFKYRWLRVEGGVETEITGETSWAYTVTADDVGKTLKVEVSYTDGDGFEEGPLTSAASAVIEAVDRSAIDFTHYEGFSLHADNSDPWSIWSDGTTLWVGDDAGEKVFAYHLVDDPRHYDGQRVRDPGLVQGHRGSQYRGLHRYRQRQPHLGRSKRPRPR